MIFITILDKKSQKWPGGPPGILEISQGSLRGSAGLRVFLSYHKTIR
jgi:hypothetical protein